MNIEHQLDKISQFKNLELLAHQIVEGFLSGKHKSPFHGFSAEFAEHKIYNTGESTKFIDWKLFAKTDRLYTKKYEDETNLRCHFIIDNSSSMRYPTLLENESFYKTKIGFSVLATAVLMNLLKKQRDAVGLSIFSNTYEYYFAEKGSDRHHRMLLNCLETLLNKPQEPQKTTDTTTFLHQIAENIHRRSMIILFTDMFQQEDNSKLFKALQHLKHNKHKVVLFHTYDYTTEFIFDFDNKPRKFMDVETGEEINLYADQIKEMYQNSIKKYFDLVKLNCMRYNITYYPTNISDSFENLIIRFLAEKQSFKN